MQEIAAKKAHAMETGILIDPIGASKLSLRLEYSKHFKSILLEDLFAKMKQKTFESLNTLGIEYSNEYLAPILEYCSKILDTNSMRDSQECTDLNFDYEKGDLTAQASIDAIKKSCEIFNATLDLEQDSVFKNPVEAFLSKLGLSEVVHAQPDAKGRYSSISGSGIERASTFEKPTDASLRMGTISSAAGSEPPHGPAASKKTVKKSDPSST